jgi:hypothetical protein
VECPFAGARVLPGAVAGERVFAVRLTASDARARIAEDGAATDAPMPAHAATGLVTRAIPTGDAVRPEDAAGTMASIAAGIARTCRGRSPRQAADLPGFQRPVVGRADDRHAE